MCVCVWCTLILHAHRNYWIGELSPRCDVYVCKLKWNSSPFTWSSIELPYSLCWLLFTSDRLSFSGQFTKAPTTKKCTHNNNQRISINLRSILNRFEIASVFLLPLFSLFFLFQIQFCYFFAHVTDIKIRYSYSSLFPWQWHWQWHGLSFHFNDDRFVVEKMKRASERTRERPNLWQRTRKFALML